MNKKFQIFSIQKIDMILMCFIFLLLFILPVIFTKVDGNVSWTNVIKIWKDRVLLIPLFVFNHWLLVPKLMLKKRYKSYTGIVTLCIALITLSYYFHDKPRPHNPVQTFKNRLAPLPEKKVPAQSTPTAVPPFADLLMFSLLIVSIDNGLSFTKHWHRNEEDKFKLEKENTIVQLAMLRNQISPHFFMNTLNNIYALIDFDTVNAKEAVMKLSKLMRYMLYENENGKVLLSKEFEFIKSYIDLMKLRFTDEMTVRLILPDIYLHDYEIPPMLFISYIENAFKYGISYQHQSYIDIVFEIADNNLIFMCNNTKSVDSKILKPGGLGLKNSQNRLKLLFEDNYSLSINSKGNQFNVLLMIPIS